MAIQSFGDDLTDKIFHGLKDKETAKFPADLISVTVRKLDMLEAAVELADLKSPPGNKLHALKDDLKGYHAISINDQWRVIFIWKEGGPEKVQIKDYH